MNDTEIEGGAQPQAEERRVAEPEERLRDQERRIDELSRALADVINQQESFKRRVERERDWQRESDRSTVAAALLDALAELRRALEAAGAEGGQLAAGVGLIAEEIERKLGALGIVRIPALGEKFDPNLHEAIEMAPVDDAARDGQVVREVTAGWRSGTRVVRPSRVVVGRLRA